MSIRPNNANGNGSFPQDVPGAARFYHDRGVLPVPVVPRGKRPILDAWEELRPTREDLSTLFPSRTDRNIGAILGEPSGGLLDVDLDSAEALLAAPLLLPPTNWISGRASAPRSHWWYTVAFPPAKASTKYKDVGSREQDNDQEDGRSVLVELRSTGGQTVLPPSIHPSGELLVWHVCEQPAKVALSDLRTAVAAVAAAALLARHWPPKGSRHDLALAIAGGLLRADWTPERAATFLNATCLAARTGDVATKIQTIESTQAKLVAGENVTGWPSVVELLGPHGSEIVSRVCKWLAIRRDAAKTATAKKPPRVLEPYKPFPVADLPSPLREYVQQARTLAGRRRVLDVKASDTLRLNSPVQGTGPDGLKLALALQWQRREQCPGAFPVLVVHDEIVVECDHEHADAAGAWLRQAMLDGMVPLVDPVPVEVEVKTASTWGG